MRQESVKQKIRLVLHYMFAYVEYMYNRKVMEFACDTHINIIGTDLLYIIILFSLWYNNTNMNSNINNETKDCYVRSAIHSKVQDKIFVWQLSWTLIINSDMSLKASNLYPLILNTANSNHYTGHFDYEFYVNAF